MSGGGDMGKDQLTIILEDMNRKIDLVLEGQKSLREEIKPGRSGGDTWPAERLQEGI